jgi:hypothetical protein
MKPFYNRLVVAEEKRHAQRIAEITIMRQMLLAADPFIRRAEDMLGCQLSVDYYLCGAFCDNHRFALRLTDSTELLDNRLYQALMRLGMTEYRRDNSFEWDSVTLQHEDVLIALNVSPGLRHSPNMKVAL